MRGLRIVLRSVEFALDDFSFPKSVAVPKFDGAKSNTSGLVSSGSEKSSGVAPKGVTPVGLAAGGGFVVSASLSGKTSNCALAERGSIQKEKRLIENAIAIEDILFIDLSGEGIG